MAKRSIIDVRLGCKYASVYNYIFFLKKKWMDIRAFYSNELKKFSDGKKSGAGLDDSYESKWGHFSKTNFISQTNLIV